MSHRSFRELLGMEGVREERELRGPVGFMAYHGGALEEQTDVIAREAAEASGASYYAVVQPDTLKWHIPSHRVRADESPVLAGFMEHVQAVITIHGFGRDGMWTTLLLGGKNRDLAHHVADHLRPGLPMYTLETEVDSIPRELRGMHQHNPVNVPPHHGVQIELPPRVRGRSPIWADWTGPGHVPHMRALIDGLAAAARSWTVPPAPLRERAG